MDPPLTIIEQPMLRLGVLTAERLLARIKGEDPESEVHTLESLLIERGSVAPPGTDPSGHTRRTGRTTVKCGSAPSSFCTRRLGEALRPEGRQHRMLLPRQDLAGQQFAREKAQRGAGVGNGSAFLGLGAGRVAGDELGGLFADQHGGGIGVAGGD